MEWSNLLPVIAVLAAPVLGYLSANYASRESRKANDAATVVDFNKGLLTRVEKLEQDVSRLNDLLRSAQDIQRAAFSYIERLLLFIVSHTLPNTSDVPPIPDQLQEHITIRIPERGNNSNDER